MYEKRTATIQKLKVLLMACKIWCKVIALYKRN